LPPTDVMKTLSRADQRISYDRFVVSLNIGRYIDEERIYNILPYTMNILLNGEIYNCLGMNICIKNSITPIILYRDNVAIENIVITLRTTSKICYDKIDSVLYLFNNNISMISKNDIKMITILKEDYSVDEYMHRIDNKLSEKRVIGITLYYESGYTISISSINPFSFECFNRRVCEAEQIHVDPLFLVSKKPLVFLMRKLLVRNNLKKMNIEIKFLKPIIEFLDMATLINSIEFYENYIRIRITNIMSRPINSVLRSWIPITKVVVDEVAEYSNRYGIIRIALPAYGSALIDLYLSNLSLESL